MLMHWVKAFHLIGMVAWFSGLFYLPRLYVYHADAHDTISLKRFNIMESKLYYIIMTPAAIITVILGLILLSAHPTRYLQASWMQMKLILVALLIGYHIYLGHLLKRFKKQANTYSSTYYRFINEIPTLILISTILLVVIRPF